MTRENVKDKWPKEKWCLEICAQQIYQFFSWFQTIMDEEYDEGFFARLEEISKLDSKCFNVRFIYVNLLEIFG